MSYVLFNKNQANTNQHPEVIKAKGQKTYKKRKSKNFIIAYDDGVKFYALPCNMPM